VPRGNVHCFHNRGEAVAARYAEATPRYGMEFLI
jgi:hypothetical protein